MFHVEHFCLRRAKIGNQKLVWMRNVPRGTFWEALNWQIVPRGTIVREWGVLYGEVRNYEVNGSTNSLTDEQQTIHARNKDLAFLRLRCMQYEHPRQKPELDCLVNHRKGAGDDRLARDNRGNSR